MISELSPKNIQKWRGELPNFTTLHVPGHLQKSGIFTTFNTLSCKNGDFSTGICHFFKKVAFLPFFEKSGIFCKRV